MKQGLPISIKLFISHVCAVLLVSGSIGSFFYLNALDNLQTGLKERLQSSAALISQTIDADNLRNIRHEADTASPDYQATLQHLRALRRMNPDIAFLYIMRQEGGRIYFVVDSDETEKQAMPGKVYTDVQPMLLMGFIGISVDKEITQDEWGAFLSGYAPLKNGTGEFLLGIDMRADQVQEKFNNLRLAGIASLIASITLAFLFARYLTLRFMGRINLAIGRCKEIAEGKLNNRIIVSSNDEFDRLLLAVNDMSSALVQAEEQRKQTVADLVNAKEELEIRVTQRTADLKEVNDRLSNEVAQRIVAQNALQEAASTDHLTRLMNRRAVLERLEYEFAHNQRNQSVLTLLLVDLDHFKTINDSKGHDAGDNVLMEVAMRMKNMLRSPDMVARWGGEEFLIVLPNTELEGGLWVAEKIRGHIANTPFYCGGEALQITASFGAVHSSPDCSIDRLIQSADRALYQAKRQGRNCVETHIAGDVDTV